MTGRRRPAGAGLLRLYPSAWRDRYETEVVALLEVVSVDWRGRLDLVRGALDARFQEATRLSATAALLAGGLWTIVGAAVVAQPAPPDWPGYLLETLPLAIVAVGAGGLAALGCWARRRDRAGRAGVGAALLAVIGHLIWAAALVVAAVGLDYGWATALAQAAGAVGCLIVGFVLLRSGDERVGGLLVLAPTLLLFGWPVAWLAFGLAWTVVGVLLLTGLGNDDAGVQPAG